MKFRRKFKRSCFFILVGAFFALLVTCYLHHLCIRIPCSSLLQNIFSVFGCVEMFSFNLVSSIETILKSISYFEKNNGTKSSNIKLLLQYLCLVKARNFKLTITILSYVKKVYRHFSHDKNKHLCTTQKGDVRL